MLNDREWRRGETLEYYQRVRDPDGVLQTVNTASNHLKLQLTNVTDGAVTSYLSSDTSRWQNLSTGYGYWLFTEAESASLYADGDELKVDEWYIDTSTSLDTIRHLGSAYYTVVNPYTGTLP